jgi:hypothetical protein
VILSNWRLAGIEGMLHLGFLMIPETLVCNSISSIYLLLQILLMSQRKKALNSKSIDETSTSAKSKKIHQAVPEYEQKRQRSDNISALEFR